MLVNIKLMKVVWTGYGGGVVMTVCYMFEVVAHLIDNVPNSHSFRDRM